MTLLSTFHWEEEVIGKAFLQNKSHLTIFRDFPQQLLRLVRVHVHACLSNMLHDVFEKTTRRDHRVIGHLATRAASPGGCVFYECMNLKPLIFHNGC